MSKCAALLKQDVCVVLVDIVTIRNNNLYLQLLDYFELTDSVMSETVSIYGLVRVHVLEVDQTGAKDTKSDEGLTPPMNHGSSPRNEPVAWGLQKMIDRTMAWPFQEPWFKSKE